MKLAVGVNSTWPATIATVPPTALLTLVMVSVWPASLAGPLKSLPVSAAKEMLRVPLSSATLDSASSVATGASLTSVTLKVTWPVSVLGSASAVGGAVVAGHVVERGGAVEVGRRGELDMARHDRHRAADRVLHAGDGERLAGLVGRTLGVVAGQRRKGDAADAAVLGDARQRVVGRHRRVVDLGDGEGDVAGVGLGVGERHWWCRCPGT